MQNVFSLEPLTQIPPGNSYVISYPYLIEYFEKKASIGAGDVVRGAHMVYGWMPTILELYSEQNRTDLAIAAALLNNAKVGNPLSAADLTILAALVNNSLVGASKLLHFVAPESYPIWDSKVYSFIHEARPHHYRINDVSLYLQYVALLRNLAANCAYPEFHASVELKLGYKVSALRALELIMFLNAPAYGGVVPAPSRKKGRRGQLLASPDVYVRSKAEK